MTRSMLRDALSALAAVTLVTAVPDAPASAQGQSVRTYRAELAIGAIRGPKPRVKNQASMDVARDVVPLAGPVSPRDLNGQNWRWFQDYGGRRYSHPSVQKELSLSDDQ